MSPQHGDKQEFPKKCITDFQKKALRIMRFAPCNSNSSPLIFMITIF